MENYIIAAVLVVIAVGIIAYLVREKKKGKRCVGCPYASQCGGKCNSACNKADK